MASEPAIARVRLYSRTNCTLCEIARDDLERICTPLAIAFAEVDVDTDPEMRAEFGDRVPVIMVDGREVGYFRVEEAALLAALR